MKKFFLGILAALLLIGQTMMAQEPNYDKLSGGLEIQLKNYLAETAVTRSNNLPTQEQLLMTLVKADSEETLICSQKACDFEFATNKDDFEVTLVYDNDAQSTVTFKASDFNPAITKNMKTVIIDCGHGKKLPFGVNVASKRVMKDGRTAWCLQILMPHYTDDMTVDELLTEEVPEKRTVSVTVTSSSEMALLADSPTCNFSGGNGMINAPYTINRPGAYNDIISVGATDRRTEFTNATGKVTTSTFNKNTPFDVISWSSCGPTLDGRRKLTYSYFRPSVEGSPVRKYSNNLVFCSLNRTFAGKLRKDEETKFQIPEGISLRCSHRTDCHHRIGGLPPVQLAVHQQ